ncbi:MAG: ATP-dependent metallopeptidase FtsH/Yme1/Tma family protein, partial [Nocardioides sp.]
MKRLFKGPWLWIVVAVVGVLLALQYLAPNKGGEEIDTSQMNAYIASGEIKEITFIDIDQVIRATLDNGDKVTTYWVAGAQEDMIAAVQKQVTAGNIEKYNSEVATPSLLGSILSFLLPFVLILVIFLFFMNQVGGGGGRGVMQFAKS